MEIDKERLSNNYEELTQIINEANKKIIYGESINDDIKLNIVRNYSNLFLILTSLNLDKKILVKNLIDLIEILPDFWIQEKVKFHMGRGKNYKVLDQYFLGYHIMMRWFLSLSILMDLPIKKINILADLIKRDNINDSLYDFLISSKLESWSITDEMSVKSPKNKIPDIIFELNKINCQKMIKTYLESQWYQTYKNSTLYDIHIHFPNSFYGYWAYEVAAIVKIKGLDDSSFRDNPYYPKDLV